MQYVGNLFNTVTEFYKELNPSTLSGAIDVIVVKQAEGTLACSPFHVRFGLLQLLRPHEKAVEVEVNGVKIDHRMKLGESGEAFFVFESENPVPSEFATSPLLGPGDQTTDDIDYFALPTAESDGKTIAESPRLLEELTLNPTKEEKKEENQGSLRAGRHLSDGEIVPNVVQENGELILDKKGYNSKSTLKRNNSIHHHLSLSNLDEFVSKEGFTKIDENREVRSDVEGAFSSDDEFDLYRNRHDRPFSDTEYEYQNDEKTSDSKTENYGSYRRWTSWFRKSTTSLSIMSSDDESTNPLTPPSNKDRKGRKARFDKYKANSGSASSQSDDNDNSPPLSAQKKVHNYAKTLRLTSDQLSTIGLKPGPNTLTFSVGTASCSSRIFLWNYDDLVVISDIDGTITKSDALGHLFNMVGKDWTHPGVAKLYTDIFRNGYKVLYLTSRAIGQADSTREYLKGIDQNQFQLPDGPVIMSPDRLFQSLHREVVLRKPHLFKMACLKDVQSLFGTYNPFYSGFGNRITDALSYRSVNVPVSRIFTIDYSGDIQHELIISYNTSYIKLTDLVDQIFPPINTKLDTDYNDWNFWKPTFMEIDLPFADPKPSSKPETPPKVEEAILEEGDSSDDDILGDDEL